MLFEYDPIKSESNRVKHGIDFEEAQELWENLYLKASARNRGEQRYAVVGIAQGIHWTAIATDRDGAIRIISVRRSTPKEVKQYEQRKNNSRES